MAEQIAGNRDVQVGQGDTLTVTGDQTVRIGHHQVVEVRHNQSLKVGHRVLVQAGDALELRCGQASIVLHKDGSIVLRGKDITIEGSGKVRVKDSAGAPVAGRQITEN